MLTIYYFAIPTPTLPVNESQNLTLFNYYLNILCIKFCLSMKLRYIEKYSLIIIIIIINRKYYKNM